MISDPLFLAVAAVSVTLLGLAKGGFYGLGMMATPLLALVVPPVQAAGILLPILLVGDVISVWAYRRDWDPWLLQVMLPGAAIGVAAGWALAAYLPQDYVRLAIGLIALVFTLNYWLDRRPPKPVAKRSAPKGVFWASLAGFTSFIAHAGGPPYSVYMLPLKLDKLIFAGTTTILFAAVNAMKVVPYFYLGQLSADNLKTSLAFLPLAVATTLLGVWLVRRTPQQMFYRIVYLLMFLIGLELVRGGLVGIFGS
jgi:uncharacterized membrane protein YfcA